jgi:hypothetical protein
MKASAIAALLFLILPPLAFAQGQVDSKRPAVLVCPEGCRYFGLDTLSNVKAVRLDVTKPEEVTPALEVIVHDARRLNGLVNNGTWSS